MPSGPRRAWARSVFRLSSAFRLCRIQEDVVVGAVRCRARKGAADLGFVTRASRGAHVESPCPSEAPLRCHRCPQGSRRRDGGCVRNQRRTTARGVGGRSSAKRVGANRLFATLGEPWRIGSKNCSTAWPWTARGDATAVGPPGQGGSIGGDDVRRRDELAARPRNNCAPLFGDEVRR